MLLHEWNLADAVTFAKEDGMELGRTKEKIKLAKGLQAEGMDVDTIARLTGLTVDDVLRL